MRKNFKAFSRGSIEFLLPENAKVLAFLRRHEHAYLAPFDQQFCILTNLSNRTAGKETKWSRPAGHTREITDERPLDSLSSLALRVPVPAMEALIKGWRCYKERLSYLRPRDGRIEAVTKASAVSRERLTSNAWSSIAPGKRYFPVASIVLSYQFCPILLAIVCPVVLSSAKKRGAKQSSRNGSTRLKSP